MTVMVLVSIKHLGVARDVHKDAGEYRGNNVGDYGGGWGVGGIGHHVRGGHVGNSHHVVMLAVVMNYF